MTTPKLNLQALLDAAPTGAVIQLPPGRYVGNFSIDRSLTLEGLPGAVIDGDGRGDVLRVRAAKVHIRGLDIRNWGDDLTAMNAGIFVESSAFDVTIENNQLQGNGFGIWLDRIVGGKILNNRIQGNAKMRSADRGNGIHLSIVSQVEVRGNEVWHTRDGLYISSSQNNWLVDNFLHDLRYGVHYMYSHHNEIARNRALRTRAGYALMQSRELKVADNLSEDSENYGFLLNYITYSELLGNRVLGVQSLADKVIEGGEGKALFVYNSLFNRIENNLFKGADIGIHLTAGSEDNSLSGNQFVDNPVQVKYVATRLQEWSVAGRGNYWSNYLGWDLNHDGRGDTPFEPNDGVDKLVWKYPQVKILMNSPAILLLRWVQRQFPVLKSPGVRDSFPLMTGPTPSGANR